MRTHFKGTQKRIGLTRFMVVEENNKKIKNKIKARIQDLMQRQRWNSEGRDHQGMLLYMVVTNFQFCMGKINLVPARSG